MACDCTHEFNFHSENVPAPSGRLRSGPTFRRIGPSSGHLAPYFPIKAPRENRITGERPSGRLQMTLFIAHSPVIQNRQRRQVDSSGRPAPHTHRLQTREPAGPVGVALRLSVPRAPGRLDPEARRGRLIARLVCVRRRSWAGGRVARYR